MGDAEKTVLVRAQLLKFLPEHLRALVAFNTDKTCDQLLIALDQTISKSSLTRGDELLDETTIKMEKLDINTTSTGRPNRSNYFDGECFYCKKPGHRLAECLKRKRANEKAIESGRHGEKSEGRSFQRSRDSRDSRDQGSSFRYGASSNVVSVNADDSESIDSNAVEAQEVHLNAVSNSVPLLRRSVRVGAYGSKFKLVALFDGGATNSFVRLSCLPDAVKQQIITFRDSSATSLGDLSKKLYSIVGVTGTAVEPCVVGTFKLTFGNWTGKHTLIISENLNDKEMIIGRDFLKCYNVRIDHGNDSITLDRWH